MFLAFLEILPWTNLDCFWIIGGIIIISLNNIHYRTARLKTL